MSRDWKPGDVALVLNQHGVWNRAICSVKPFGTVWQYGVTDLCSTLDADARPLVVIDPEDSRGIAIEIAQKVGDAWDIAPGTDILKIIAAVQAALREFANPTPPKPDEPTKVGALVVDADGETWVRHVRGEWSCLYSPPGRDIRTWVELCDQYGPIRPADD